MVRSLSPLSGDATSRHYIEALIAPIVRTGTVVRSTEERCDDDFLGKPLALDEFVARVRRLLERVEGRTVLGLTLTPRGFEVLTLVAEGLARDEIARRLFISPKTVGTHIEHIFRKLGVHTRAQAVSLAYEHGFLPAASSGGRRG